MFYLLFPIVSVANEELVTIKFEDKNLYNAISEQLEVKINSKDNNNLTITMTRENIESVDTLYNTNSKSIEKLNGLENFINLTRIGLANNKISDISVLSSLVNLTELNDTCTKQNDFTEETFSATDTMSSLTVG